MELVSKAKEFLYANNFELVREYLGKGVRSVTVSAPLGRFDMVNMFGTEAVARFDGGAVKFVGEEFCVVREGRTKNLAVFAPNQLAPAMKKVGAKVPAFSFSPSMVVKRAVESFAGVQFSEYGEEDGGEDGFKVRTFVLKGTEEFMVDALKNGLRHAAAKLSVPVNLEVFETGFAPMLSSMAGGGTSGARALFDLACTQIGFEFSNVQPEGDEPTFDFDCAMVLERGDFKAKISLVRGMDAWDLDVVMRGARSGETARVEALYCEEPLTRLLEIVGGAPVVVGQSSLLTLKAAA